VKTFQQFQQDLQEAIPLALPAAGLALPVIGGAVKLAQGYLQAKKQGEGRRSQPVDYGQGGETTSRTPNVQRPSPKLTAAETQRRQAAADRRAEARERARTNTQQRIDDLIGSDAERAAAAKARANQPQIQQQLRRQATRNRMSQAADRLGLPEQMTAPKIMLPIDTRTTKEKQKEIKIEADLLPYNPAIGDRYKTK